MNMSEEENERLVELANEVYHAKKRIEGTFTTGMYGNKFMGLNDMHERALNILRGYEDLLDSILK